MDDTAWNLKEAMQVMPITKDVGSIRTKGILLEDALSLLKERLNLKCIHGFREGSYEQMIYEGEGVRIAWAYYRLSIPALVVGVDTKERWHRIRMLLRDAKFVR